MRRTRNNLCQSRTELVELEKDEENQEQVGSEQNRTGRIRKRLEEPGASWVRTESEEEPYIFGKSDN